MTHTEVERLSAADYGALHGYYLEDLEVGMTAVFSKTITDADVVLFGGLSGDTNPLHLDRDFAARTRFGGPIVHGMLTASLISTLIGTRLPGPGCVWMGQTLKWLAPVRVGDTVLARVTVLSVDRERARATLDARCTVAGATVVSGESLVKLPRRTISA